MGDGVKKLVHNSRQHQHPGKEKKACTENDGETHLDSVKTGISKAMSQSFKQSPK